MLSERQLRALLALFEARMQGITDKYAVVMPRILATLLRRTRLLLLLSGCVLGLLLADLISRALF